MNKPDLERDGAWSTSLAVGSEEYINKIKAQSGMTARYREAIVDKEDKWLLRETEAAYSAGFEVEMGGLGK